MDAVAPPLEAMCACSYAALAEAIPTAPLLLSIQEGAHAVLRAVSDANYSLMCTRYPQNITFL